MCIVYLKLSLLRKRTTGPVVFRRYENEEIISSCFSTCFGIIHDSVWQQGDP